MLNKIFNILLVVLILVNAFNVVIQYKIYKDKKIEVRNVLPKNENKELKRPDEVRQYVGVMAVQKGVNVDMVDHIGMCESHFDRYAVSKSGTYVGIFQIGSIHNLGDDRFDVVKSTKWSLDKMKREGFKAWECSKI